MRGGRRLPAVFQGDKTMGKKKLLPVLLRAALASAAVVAGMPAASGAASGAEVSEAAAQDTPEAAFERYRTLINTHEFERLAEAVIAPDALFVFTDKTHRGMEEIRAAFNRTWQTLPDEVYTMGDAQWLARDRDSALVVFRYSYRGTTPTGQLLTGGGHGTNLYKRTPAGWRLAYEHLSHDPQPAPKKAAPAS